SLLVLFSADGFITGFIRPMPTPRHIYRLSPQKPLVIPRQPKILFSFGHSKGAVLLSFAHCKGEAVEESKSEVLQGTLDLMILKALTVLGPLHGYGIARRLEQISEDLLRLNEGTVYTALLRLQQKGWISSEWGASENNRKAKYYSITRSGRKQLA